MKKLTIALLSIFMLLCSWIVCAHAEPIRLEEGDYSVSQDLPAGLYSVTAELGDKRYGAIMASEPTGEAVPKPVLYNFTVDAYTVEVSLPEGTTFSVNLVPMNFTLLEAYSSVSPSEAAESATPEDPIPIFDHAGLLSNLEGYSYDKFDRNWKWYQAYVKNYTDATLIVGMQVLSSDNAEHINEADFYIRFLDASQSAIYEPVTSVDFIIDDDVYSYKTMCVLSDCSMVTLAKNGNLFIEALAFCNPETVEMRIGTNSSSYTVDIDPTDFMWTLKDMCRTYLELHMWDFVSDKADMNALEEHYPLTINGQPADYATMHKERDLSRIDETFTLPKPTPSLDPAPTPSPTPTSSQYANSQQTQSPTSSGFESGIGTTYELGQGIYEVGDDIPAGRYLVEWTGGNQFGGYLNPVVGCEQFGIQLSIDPGFPSVILVTKGDQFEVSLINVRLTSITVLPNDFFKQADGTYLLYPGYYYVSIDLPAGKYNVTAIDGNQYGIYVYVNGAMISLSQGETYNNLKLNNSAVVEVSLGEALFEPR